ncbi:hypothetical protein [Pseudomonas huanghezhanensis]|uniref:hypothetical protein n=1 Tax=Pseudomonas huanghezhanensis TaxID=3002903 RepID=UPI002285457F|nr:hypothetical protein [Pseudomonas sp. BSw22131]
MRSSQLRGASALVTARFVMATNAATRKTFTEILRGLSRQERLKLAVELHRSIKSSGKLPRRYTNFQIRQQAVNQIKDLIASALTIAGSALSGNLHALAIGIYGEHQ